MEKRWDKNTPSFLSEDVSIAWKNSLELLKKNDGVYLFMLFRERLRLCLFS